MHIIIGVITAIAGLVWALVRLQEAGVNLGALNPFWWARRRRWQKLHGSNPLHNLESTMEAAAVIVVGLAKVDVEITRDTKQEIQAQFVKAFKISEAQAMELFASSSHLLKDASNLVLEVRAILAPSLPEFTEPQKQSVLDILKNVALVESGPTPEQKQYIDEVKAQFTQEEVVNKPW